ncbi:uncharacterized protein LOC129273609 [Lytechinus pictus]|uniref:uncharacterized protein LOC129273609 n=1 Tax=Lytechinus pictus TaxID=7653 RepID=UPI0030BA2A72
MVLRTSVIECLLFLLVVIYMAKVMVVMTYLDASKEALMGRRDSAEVIRGQEGALHVNPKVRSILQDSVKMPEVRIAEPDSAVISNEEEKKPDIPDVDDQHNIIKEDGAMEKENDNISGVVEDDKDDDEDDDFAGMNAELFSKVLKTQYDHSTKCSEENLFLILLINSKPENLDFRIMIRETWANAPDAETQGVLAMFVFGKPRDRPRLDATIYEENDRYDDIILGDFYEDFRNSSLKVLTGMKWVSSHCSSAKFVFMGDDHIYLNMNRLVKSLRTLHVQENDKSMWRGRIRSTSRAIRDKNSLYYVSERLYERSVYPPFCTLDAGFVLSMSAVHELYRDSFDRSIVPFGDVLIGIVADEMKWNVVEDSLFNYRDYESICEFGKVFTLRGMSTPDKIKTVFDKISNETFLRECPDPDLDLVLTGLADNEPYLNTVLQMVHDHPKYCYNDQGREDKIFILNLVSSLPRHFEARQAIRETWGSQDEILGEKVKTLFVMGLTQRDTEEIQKQVQIEDDTNGDIIQAEFQESFGNLTLKVVMGLKWVTQNCPHATYIYKGDDDMFVNFPNIINYLKKERSSGKALKKYFMGSVLFRSVRITRKDSKYYVNEKFYSGRYFPPYCSGGGYIISTDVVPPMYEQALKTAFIPIDDAYQGILAKKVGVVPQYNGGFKNWGEKSDTCSLRREELMTIHGFKDPDAMHEVWRNFTDTSVKCGHDRR